MRSWIFYGALLALAACRNTAFSPTVELAHPSALRDSPGPAGRELQALGAGAALQETGRVGAFVTPLELGGKAFQSPWIQVQTPDQQTGWLPAAALRPLSGDAGAWYLQARMRCFFGAELTGRRNRWAEKEMPHTAAEFAADYREAMALRDTLMNRLATRAEPNEAGFQPDFFWLNEALPGFVFQMVAEGAQAYAFADWREWQRKALATNGLQDDRFTDVLLKSFPADSIESFFPAWIIQTWDNGGSSQLGSGRHLDVLRSIDAALAAGGLFRPELQALKSRLLADILDQPVTYWQPADKILTELDAIENAGLRCLDERDRLALDARRKMFEAAAENGIRVNLRAGEQ